MPRASRLLQLGLIVIGMGLVGCNAVDSRPQAEATATRLFAARGAGDRETALSFYHDAFYEHVPRQEFVQMLDDLDAILGLPRSHEASGWKIHVGSGPVGTGTYVTLSYAVEYEDASGTETLTLYSGDKGQEPRVVNHGFKSPALLER